MEPSKKLPNPPEGRSNAPVSPLSVWTDRLLGLCPMLIAVLWWAGVMLFRGHELKPIEWLTLIAAGFATQVIMRRISPKRPLPALPEGARATRLAGLLALIVGVIASIIGLVLELASQNYAPSDVPLGLRMLWHGSCAAGATYCSFLRRLLRVLPA